MSSNSSAFQIAYLALVVARQNFDDACVAASSGTILAPEKVIAMLEELSKKQRRIAGIAKLLPEEKIRS